MEEDKKEEVSQEDNKGYYLAEVPTNYQKIIAFGDKAVDADELLIKIANACEKAGILKE